MSSDILKRNSVREYVRVFPIFLPQTFLPAFIPFLPSVSLSLSLSYPSPVRFICPSVLTQSVSFYAKICVPYVVSLRSAAVTGCPDGCRFSVLGETIKGTRPSLFKNYSP
jgi:hypothetical protein